jgi:hypothetical protein
MSTLIGFIIGAAGAILYVGFFAYKIHKLPLYIIAGVCLAMMIYAFYEEWRGTPNGESKGNGG